jgi:2-oxo-4-hydroxy-4-carboxy-5-ureidoimidazoline decarboxylase
VGPPLGEACVSVAGALNDASHADAQAMLRRCCGATRWVDGMLARRPFAHDEAVMVAADEVWAQMDEADVLEAFGHHPEIGASLEALREKFASTAGWSAGEQSSVAAADEATLVALRDGNVRYRRTFGFIFIVCATGKTAAEMLELLEARLPSDRETELRVAAAEQAKITKLRLGKLGVGGR